MLVMFNKNIKLTSYCTIEIQICVSIQYCDLEEENRHSGCEYLNRNSEK
jgi:hypothetical protein